MKKILQQIQKKCSLINVANVLAMLALIGSVNMTCNWVHYQPEVPEEAKRFRKF